MANPRAKYENISALGLQRLLALHTDYDSGMASRMRLESLFGKDAPKDYFTATSGSLKTPSLTDHSLKQETDSMHLSRRRTDSEKAVKGSDDESLTDGRVKFQDAAVEELGVHIPKDSSEELSRRGKEADGRTSPTYLFFVQADREHPCSPQKDNADLEKYNSHYQWYGSRFQWPFWQPLRHGFK